MCPESVFCKNFTFVTQGFQFSFEEFTKFYIFPGFYPMFSCQNVSVIVNVRVVICYWLVVSYRVE